MDESILITGAMQLPKKYRLLKPHERRQVREEYVRRQKGLCHHCKHPLKGPPANSITELPLNLALFPPGFLTYPVHLHHCHRSGFTIGAVHAYCNGVLFQYHGE